MFRACISGSIRAVASSSNRIHTSAVLCSNSNRRTGARNKKKNQQKTVAVPHRPSVILGTRLKDGEKTWKECALAKTLIDEESLSSTNLVSKNFAIGKVNVPTQFGFGVERAEEEMLFNALPVLTSDMALRGTLDEELYDADLENQQIKAQMFAKILDLRNANAGGIAAVNRLRIIYAFSTPERPFNTGRTEVQVALLTYKIRNVWKHLTTCRGDVSSRRSIRILVHQRAALLRYLKRKSRERYDILLEKLALEPESVEGELVI